MAKVYLISKKDKDSIIDLENTVYKIGVTKQKVENRIKQLQTGSDKKLETVKTFESNFAYSVERNLHKIFNHKRINREWFKLDENDVTTFLLLCQKFEHNFNTLNTLNT